MIVRLCTPTSAVWANDITKAKELDRLGMTYGQTDPDHHLCCEQRSQHYRGHVQVWVDTNIYGWVVRDTMNDGLGRLYGGRDRPGTTREEAIAWAKAWYAEQPTHREVIILKSKLEGNT